MNRYLSTTIALVLALCSLSVSAPADLKGLHRTKTVDKSDDQAPKADWPTIQQAIDSITPGNEKWTVLVFAGTYAESVELGPTRPNIDIVGVDPDAVIIAPPADADAITIRGDGARNNTIRNLTINTTGSGRGIVIRHEDGSPTPSDIRIENCRITTSSGSAIVIEHRATKVRIVNCVITVQGSGADGIVLSAARTSDIEITGTTINTQTDRSRGVVIRDVMDNVRLLNSSLSTLGSTSHCIHVEPFAGTDPVTHLQISGCRLSTPGGSPGGGQSDAVSIFHPVDSLALEDTFITQAGLPENSSFALYLSAGAAGSRNIDLRGVTVRSTIAGNMIVADAATGLRIDGCDFLDVDAFAGVIVGDDASITNSTIVIDRNFGPNRIGHDDGAAVQAVGKSGLRISSSRLQGREGGLRLLKNCRDVAVSNCELGGVFYGVRLECGEDIQLQNCRLVADERLRRRDDPDPPPVLPAQYAGLWIDDREADPACEPGRIELVACDLRALNEQDTDRSVFGVLASAAPTAAAGPARLSDCTIDARLLDAASNGRCFGAAALEAAALALVGGAVTSSDADEREPNQFDVFNNVPLFPSTAIAVSGTRFSRWRGPIGPAVQASSLVQRVVNVAAAADDAVLAATALTASEQEITTGITNPDVYRVLSVRGNQPIMNQTVIVIGTNLAGESIADAISLVGTTIASGVKPFQSVRKIILPPQSGPGQQVSVGTTTWLGLRIAFSSTTDLQQQARKAADADMYTVEEAGSPNPTWSTLDVGPITDGDSFEFTLLASR